MAGNLSRSSLVALAMCSTLGVSSTAAAQIPDRNVHVWIKAFISPPEGASATFEKTGGGKWGLRAPLSIMPLLPKGCFGIDDRDFSNDPNASARVTFEANLLVKAREMQVLDYGGKKKIRIGSTTNFDCQTGAELQLSKSAAESTVTISSVKKSPNGRLFTFNVRASSPNPYYDFGVPLAPRIDFEAVFQFNVITQKLTITGTTGVFPSFEMYYALNGGAAVTVFKRAPATGVGPGSLADFGTGVNTVNFKEVINLPKS